MSVFEPIELPYQEGALPTKPPTSPSQIKNHPPQRGAHEVYNVQKIQREKFQRSEVFIQLNILENKIRMNGVGFGKLLQLSREN